VSNQAQPRPSFLDGQLPALEINVVEIGDFEFAARRRSEARGDFDNPAVIKIESRHRPVRACLPRLLLDRDGSSGHVELDHPVGFGVAHLVSENGGARPRLRRALQNSRQAANVENVVAEHEGYRPVADELAADQKCLRESIRPRLLGIGDLQAPLAAILQHRLEPRTVRRCRDDEDVADAG
jgi:hypothetical protein